jgi:hypothetical protein
MGGPKMFVIRLDDKSAMRIPRSWTDADGARAGMDAPAHVFTADALRELGALVASMARPSSLEHAMASSRADRVTDATSCQFAPPCSHPLCRVMQPEGRVERPV